MFKGSVRVLVAYDKYMVFKTPNPMIKTCWKRKLQGGDNSEGLRPLGWECAYPLAPQMTPRS